MNYPDGKETSPQEVIVNFETIIIDWKVIVSDYAELHLVSKGEFHF